MANDRYIWRHRTSLEPDIIAVILSNVVVAKLLQVRSRTKRTQFELQRTKHQDEHAMRHDVSDELEEGRSQLARRPGFVKLDQGGIRHVKNVTAKTHWRGGDD